MRTVLNRLQSTRKRASLALALGFAFFSAPAPDFHQAPAASTFRFHRVVFVDRRDRSIAGEYSVYIFEQWLGHNDIDLEVGGGRTSAPPGQTTRRCQLCVSLLESKMHLLLQKEDQ